MFGKTILLSSIQGKPLRLDVPERDEMLNFKPWVNDQEVTQYVSKFKGFTHEDELDWYDKTRTQEDKISWMIYYDGKPIGNCGLFKLDFKDQNAEYGVMIGDKTHWKKGIGTAVLQAVTELAFEELNLQTIYIRIFESNLGSLKSAEKVGFQKYGLQPDVSFMEGRFQNFWLGYLKRPLK